MRSLSKRQKCCRTACLRCRWVPRQKGARICCSYPTMTARRARGVAPPFALNRTICRSRAWRADNMERLLQPILVLDYLFAPQHDKINGLLEKA